MQQKLSSFLFGVLLMLSCNAIAVANESLPTFFHYQKSHLNALKRLETKETLDQKDLQKWDVFCENTAERLGLKYDFRTLFFTYLYSAQRDAAFLSYEAKDCFEGSFDPISAKVFKLFFPNEPLPEDLKQDAYSEMLASIVIKKYATRLEKERKLPSMQ